MVYNLYSMNTTTRTMALGILEGAEQSLRQLISQAALEQQYDEVAWIVELAKQVASVRKRNAAAIEHPKRTSPRMRSDRPVASKPQDLSSAREKPGSYPRFHAEDDRLIKTGWSKRNKTEYEHRAPKATIKKVFDALSLVSQEGPFDVDSISALVVTDDDPTPNYQIYMVLGWLRANSCLVKRGRSKYAVTNSFRSVDFQDLWQQLRKGNQQ